MADKSILITGASGFVGSRLAARLVLGEEMSVRAFVHRLSSPGVARLSRLPIKMIFGDLLDVASLSAAIEGCEVVVHLAYGNSGDPSKQEETTILGTENLLKVALEKNIKKVIYLSTAAVHGLKSKEASIDESATFEKCKNVYRRSKIKAEQIVWKYIHQHKLPVVIFRPPLIYGPYGADWTVRIVNEIKNGAILINGGKGVANLVYVDNLIEAILLAIKKDSGDGEAFFVVDDEYPSWKEVYNAYSKMISVYPTMINMTFEEIKKLRNGNPIRKNIIAPFFVVPSMFRTCFESAKFRRELKQIPWIEFLINRIPRDILEGMKGQEKKNDISSSDEIDGGILLLPNKDLVDLYSSQARYSNVKIKKMLGYKQLVPFEKAMDLTCSWLRYQRLVP